MRASLLWIDPPSRTAAILDRHLATKRWGGLLMRGLPDFEVIVEPTGRRAAGE